MVTFNNFTQFNRWDESTLSKFACTNITVKKTAKHFEETTDLVHDE